MVDLLMGCYQTVHFDCTDYTRVILLPKTSFKKYLHQLKLKRRAPNPTLSTSHISLRRSQIQEEPSSWRIFHYNLWITDKFRHKLRIPPAAGPPRGLSKYFIFCLREPISDIPYKAAPIPRSRSPLAIKWLCLGETRRVQTVPRQHRVEEFWAHFHPLPSIKTPQLTLYVGPSMRITRYNRPLAERRVE